MHFRMLSAISFNLDQFKIVSSGNGLTIYNTTQNFNDPGKGNFLKKKGYGKMKKCW